MKTTTTILVLAGALALAHAAQAADLNAGAEKAKQVCGACHGADGNSQVADYPKLAGQHPDYLAKALRDYKSGVRKNPIMGGMAASLTRQDIENLAAYFGRQTPVLSSRE